MSSATSNLHALPDAVAASTPTSVPSEAEDWYGLPPMYLKQLIDDNGGEAAFEGLTTSNVKRSIIVPKTAVSKLSLCAQMRREGDTRVQAATWFVSHPWSMKFLDLVRALEVFFADKPGALIWMDIVSSSQHETFERPSVWWEETFCSAIGRMGKLVMVMTPWDNPICLTRAWCLIELWACRSSGGEFGVALPPSERTRFLEEIVDKHAMFYDMLSKVNTQHSECSRDADKQRIFAHVRGLKGGFTALDRGVLQTITEWLQKQLEDEIAQAVSAGNADSERNVQIMSALAELFRNLGQFSRALPLLEDCLEKRKRVLGDTHHSTFVILHQVADTLDDLGQFSRALPLFEQIHAHFLQVYGPNNQHTLQALSSLAMTLSHLGIYARALPLLEQCLAGQQLLFGEEHSTTVITLHNFVELLCDTKQFARAQPLLRLSYDRLKRIFGEDHPNTLASLQRLAVQTKDFQHAEPLHKEIMEKNKRIFGEDHPSYLVSLNNYGSLLFNNAMYRLALPIFEENLARRKRLFGEDHPRTLDCLFNLAILWRRREEYSRALRLFDDLVERSRRVLGDAHPDTQLYEGQREECEYQGSCIACLNRCFAASRY
jgi:tetratricopeptide (TPR) repeat protein